MKLAALIFQRFPDPAAEQRYSTEQRRAQVKFIRALMIIGALMISLYIVINPLFAELSFAAEMLLSSMLMLVPIGLYYWYVGRPGYTPRRWVDVALFCLFGAVQFFILRTLWQSGVPGW